jgi:signal transduction histidine kinase
VIPLGKLFRTTVFKLSLVYLVIFALGASAVIGWVAWSVRHLVDQQIGVAIKAEINGLSEQYAQGGISRLVFIVDRRTRQPNASLYLVTNFQGLAITGNVAALPPNVLDKPGVRETLYQRHGEATMHRMAMARIFVLPGGFRLLVGRDLGDRETLYQVMGRALLTSLFWLIVIGMLGGLFVARRVLQRVDAMNDSARTIMLGNLEGRLPINGSNDELDRLAQNLNAMIARINDLMVGMRDVSDNIAHDLKTPLTRLRSHAERTLATARSTSEYQGALEKVIEESDQLIKIFNALLMIARVETGTEREGLKPFDAGEIARDLAEMYEPVADDAGFDLVVDAGQNLIVHGSRELVGQVVANLLDNAIKYGVPAKTVEAADDSRKTPAMAGAGSQEEPALRPQFDLPANANRPRLTISVQRHGGDIEIAVADNGPGIPEADRERVLDRFVRLEWSRSKPGSGLGLSLAAAVARLHNGKLKLEDNHPGLRVTLVLPADSHFQGKPSDSE